MRGNERPVLDATLQVTLARGLQLSARTLIGAGLISLQVTLARGLQQSQRGLLHNSPDPSSHTCARIATLSRGHRAVLLRTFKSHLRADCNIRLGAGLVINVNLQVTLARGLQRQSCTACVTHARITMCILTFSSVLSALFSKTYDHFLDFGTEKSPLVLARISQQSFDCSMFAPSTFLIILSIPLTERFCDALKSALALKPHFTQQKRAWLNLLLLSI